MDAAAVVILLFGLAAFAGLGYYFVSNYEDPPLWWPNFARPDWDKVRGGEGGSLRGGGEGGVRGNLFLGSVFLFCLSECVRVRMPSSASKYSSSTLPTPFEHASNVPLTPFQDPENFSNLETIGNAKTGETDETDTFTGAAVKGGGKYES